ncbi:YciI family protein [Chachezhania antarctica]|uniref:YciI family protein n=1 Tax=Chachezhania antarctica TaxID=2340860 RepID=UPI000EB20DAF|nr:YciI family protein [Chachezhania antarctica]|tara:strand:- start:1110 stop:1514 length:405 start_codon:yes stop_codon:yes gene_type:complete
MSDEDNPTSVPAAGVLEASQGMLQKQLYAIFTRPVNGLGPVFANIEEHLKFQVGLEERGIMFAAGPLWTDDEQSWEGEGMVIVRAGSRDEAVAIAESDPMHKAGARSFTVRPWLINEGSITIRVDFSAQRATVG